MILAEFGASVIKVDKINTFYSIDSLGNGKRSIALNLKNHEGINIFKKLSNQSDVLIDPFRPGVMEKMKLGPEELMKANTRLIYARLNGFGNKGPYANMAGHDINYLALSGLLSLFGRYNQKPTPPANLAADFGGGGLMCAFGIMLALFERTKSNTGQIVDTSMVDGTAYLGSWLFRSQKLPGLWGNPRGKNILDSGAHFYDTYETKDGQYMCVGAIEPQFYQIFLDKLGLSEDEMPQFDKFDENREILEKIFKQKTQTEWCSIFDGTDACVTPVLNLEDVALHAHNKERKTFMSNKDGTVIPNPTPHLSRTSGRSKGYERNPERAMNYSEEQIEQKRLLALQRKKQAQVKSNPFSSSTTRNSIPSTNSNVSFNKNKETNANKSFGNYGAKSYGHNADSKSNFGNNSARNTPKFNNKQKKRFSPISTRNFFGQKSCITGKCYMITHERFALETSAYFPPLIEALKLIPSRSYDMKSKTWNFNLKDYETVMEKIINFKTDIQVIGLPKIVIELFRKNNNSENIDENIDLSKIDPQLLSSLMPFQRKGICYGISKRGRCMIADDMGLGKTIQALGIAHYFKENWPLLIIVPSSVRYQWTDAIYTFLPSVPAQYVHQFANTKDFITGNKIVITSYDLLVRAVDAFERHTFGFVILDESHALKSVKTARYKAAQRIVSKACHVVLLSGTPALSRPIELYSQISLIMRNFMGYQEYGIRYCAGEKSSFGWDFTGSSNMQELQLLLKCTCVIRRLKNEVLEELPSKKREVIVLDPDLIKIGTKEMKEISAKLERSSLTGMERHNTLLQYYNESSIAKQKAICDYVTNLLRRKQKCIIFAHHQNILDAISEVAESMDIKYIRIDGKTNPERRKYQVDKFQTSDAYLVAILSITAANAGITLTAAQLVVFAELFWNPGVLCQAEDRVHRIGQNENVVIQYLVAKQTADDYLWPLIQRKMNVLNEVGLDQDFCLKDVDVTKQTLNEKQRTLDFLFNKDCKFETDEETIQNSDNTIQQTENCFATASGEFNELLELNDEDFDFSNWDDIE
nr:PREDICTED: SWI/SNF-related matrix-associated actin-dependent regulator of chromatin subfamily A-like protein 1 isoform X2 [Megachile rotundata]